MSEEATIPLDSALVHSALPLRTALDLRAVCEVVMPQFVDHADGTPVTGNVHRGLSLKIDGSPPVAVDIVEPVAAGPRPVMIFIHGGGWVFGDIDMYHQLVSRFAEQGFVVVAVEYRLAPENKFPAGYDDCVGVVRWAMEHIAQYGGDPDRLVLAGDSAGANIASAIAVSEPDLPVKAVGLLYGVYDLEHMPTAPEIHDEVFLDDLHVAYLGANGLHLLRDSRVSPIHAAAKLPPAFISVGSGDPGMSESAKLAHALEQAGVEHVYHVIEDYPHGFAQVETLPETLPEIESIASFLMARAAG